MVATDDLEEDASSLLVSKLMHTGSNSSDGTCRSPGRQIVTAAAASVSNGSVKDMLTDGATVNGNNSIIDVSPERRSADNLHQLSLYIFLFIVTMQCSVSVPEVSK